MGVIQFIVGYPLFFYIFEARKDFLIQFFKI